MYRGEVNWILETDIVSFFDSLDRTRLKEMLQVRVADGSLLRLIGKRLRVGVLDGEAYITPDRGTAQGSGLSPLLGNVYRHYALDVWFDQVVRPRPRVLETEYIYCAPARCMYHAHLFEAGRWLNARQVEMELLPAPAAATSMLRRSPFTLADDRQTTAVDDEVKARALWHAP